LFSISLIYTLSEKEKLHRVSIFYSVIRKGFGKQLNSLAWRRLYGEKTVREAERAWFLSEGEESEALIRVAFDSLGQKQRVF
jgi:hypothetical protein